MGQAYSVSQGPDEILHSSSSPMTTRRGKTPKKKNTPKPPAGSSNLNTPSSSNSPHSQNDSSRSSNTSSAIGSFNAPSQEVLNTNTPAASISSRVKTKVYQTRSKTKKRSMRNANSPQTITSSPNIPEQQAIHSTSSTDQNVSEVSTSTMQTRSHAQNRSLTSPSALCGVLSSPCARIYKKQSNKLRMPEHVPLFPPDHFWLPNTEIPTRISELHEAEIMPSEDAAKLAWNENDASQNIIVIENGTTLHRHPVAQSTDAIRGKMSYATGMHAIEFVWEHGQRGTHAVLGVCTKEMRLERPGYCSLIGNDNNGWGWDITRNRLFHNGAMCRAGSNKPIKNERENANTGRSQTRSQTAALAAAAAAAASVSSVSSNHQASSKNLKSDKKQSKNRDQRDRENNSVNPAMYESCDDSTAFYPCMPDEFVIPARIVMILDCDEGWMGFCADGRWLGIAFSTLKRHDVTGVKRLPGPLYPCVSCVWGNCEVSMKPLSSIPAKPLSLLEICRKSLWKNSGGPCMGIQSTETMCRMIAFSEHCSGPIPKKLKYYLLAPTRQSIVTGPFIEEFCNGSINFFDTDAAFDEYNSFSRSEEARDPTDKTITALGNETVGSTKSNSKLNHVNKSKYNLRNRDKIQTPKKISDSAEIEISSSNKPQKSSKSSKSAKRHQKVNVQTRVNICDV